jgi:hypothetical protein
MHAHPMSRWCAAMFQSRVNIFLFCSFCSLSHVNGETNQWRTHGSAVQSTLLYKIACLVAHRHKVGLTRPTVRDYWRLTSPTEHPTSQFEGTESSSSRWKLRSWSKNFRPLCKAYTKYLQPCSQRYNIGRWLKPPQSSSHLDNTVLFNEILHSSPTALNWALS